MPTVRRSLWSLWLVCIVCLGLSIGGYALAASGLADKGMERLAQAWDVVSQAIKVTLATTLAGEDVANDVQKVETRGSSVNILTATTTTIKSAPGHVNHLIAVGGTMGNVTIYDNTAASGTVLFGPATPTAGGVIVADIEFSVGLTVVTAAATAISGSVR